MNTRQMSLALMAISLAFLVTPTLVIAQSLPQTEIWLAEIGTDGLPGQPVRITETSGYHNQPHFSVDGQTLFFTAEAENSQTDIWAYDLESGSQEAVNTSPFSDFSPTPIPGQNAISLVRIEADSRQRLWRTDLATAEESLLFEELEPVGYHAWLSPNRVAVFILGETFDLHLADSNLDGSSRIIANIGRTLRVDRQSGELYFVNKNRRPWEISALDHATGNIRSVIPLLPLVEDFEVDRQGRFWSGNGSKLYVSDKQSKQWRLAADLQEYGISGITRLGASPNGQWLAIVSSP